MKHHEPLLWGSIAPSLLLQVSFVDLRFLNDAFYTMSLAPSEWLLCTGMATAVLWAAELQQVRRATSPVAA